MIRRSDIKAYLRDLFYTQEDILTLLPKSKIPKKTVDRIEDNIIEKQIIITKIIRLYAGKIGRK